MENDSSKTQPPNPRRGLLKGLLPEVLNSCGKIKYNQELVLIAKQNRKNPTDAEKRLWEEVLSNRKLGFKFRRQKPILEFIVDFYCSELLLAVEVDGEYHKEQELYDDLRTEELNKIQIEVIRYTNASVFSDIEAVRANLKDKIAKRELEIYSTTPE